MPDDNMLTEEEKKMAFELFRLQRRVRTHGYEKGITSDELEFIFNVAGYFISLSKATRGQVYKLEGLLTDSQKVFLKSVKKMGKTYKLLDKRLLNGKEESSEGSDRLEKCLLQDRDVSD